MKSQEYRSIAEAYEQVDVIVKDDIDDVPKEIHKMKRSWKMSLCTAMAHGGQIALQKCT